MYRPKFIFLFQMVVLAMCAAVLLLFFGVFNPLASKTKTQDKNLASLWTRLAEVNLRNRFLSGLDLKSVTQSQIIAEKSCSTAIKAIDLVRERVDLELEYRERMSQTFSALDFEQKRNELINQIQTVAASKGVTLAPAALAGFPSPDAAGFQKPDQLWARLAYMHYLLVTASNFGAATVKNAMPLDPREHPGWNGNPGTWDELPMRIEIQGSTEAIIKFIASLPVWVDDLKEQNTGFSAPYKPILFLDHIILKTIPGDPNSANLEAVVSGFFNKTKPS